MSLISLKTELRQELKLTPQLLQSMEVLQMNSQELLDYLGKLSEENPTLELSDAPDLRSFLCRTAAESQLAGRRNLWHNLYA